MTRENITRCICERCGFQEEIPMSFFIRYPASWGKAEGRNLCTKCMREFKAAFSKFMADGRKQRQ